MPATPIWRGTDALVEDPTSPEWVFGVHVTCTRTFTGQHAVALLAAPLKGAVGTGTAAGLRVTESRVRRMRGGIGQLVIVYETVGQPGQGGGVLPPDEVSIEANNRLERPLEKHPKYSALSAETIQQITDAVESGDKAKRAEAKALFASNPRAVELFEKLVRKFTHYVIYPPTVKLTSHHWAPPATNGGGNRQVPPISPVTLPAGVDWLREGDALSYNGTHWVLVRTWIGAPDLDVDVYPAA